ncbi:ABC transporter substrate-binding protein [Amycolatopsis sp. NPDC054798]
MSHHRADRERAGQRPHARLRASAACVLIALTAAGGAACGNPDTSTGQRGKQGEIGFASCGENFALDHPPSRVVILNDAIADTLFALGVGDRIVAKTRGESAPLPELKDRLGALPDLGPRVPGTEALLAAKPDLLISDQVEKISGRQGGPAIGELKRMKIPAYVVNGCAKDQDAHGNGLDSLFTDLQQLGKIFGVPARAQALTDQLRARLNDVQARTARQPKLTVAGVSQVANQLYVTSGGLANDVLDRAGGTNLFADQPGQFAPISAEQIVARNPQTIVVDDFTASERGRADAISFLERTFPIVDAVKQHRVLVIDAAKTGAHGSIRPVEGVEEVARFLHPSAFAAQ